MKDLFGKVVNWKNVREIRMWGIRGGISLAKCNNFGKNKKGEKK